MLLQALIIAQIAQCTNAVDETFKQNWELEPPPDELLEEARKAAMRGESA
jgi:hypothetical protein